MHARRYNHLRLRSRFLSIPIAVADYEPQANDQKLLLWAYLKPFAWGLRRGYMERMRSNGV